MLALTRKECQTIRIVTHLIDVVKTMLTKMTHKKNAFAVPGFSVRKHRRIYSLCEFLIEHIYIGRSLLRGYVLQS